MYISDHDIDEVAKKICANLGLDPYHYTAVRWADTEPNYPATMHQLPIVNCPPIEVDVFHQAEQWRMFRKQAAILIAGWKAVHEQVLIGLDGE